ncbi:MAG: ribonuclease HI [Gammaproteobacteria bacterium GWF2_41_13]|nr:MAG: ribonuclease HI [Gammaproteobacteria bacterium GWF2_41_13]
MKKTVLVYTDGACRGNPGEGGWGAVLKYGEKEKYCSGYEPDTTNNQMELRAAIEALAALKQTCHVILTTDSQYVKKGITEWLPVWKQRHWKTANKKPVKNSELWRALDREASRHTVEWHWVKGHAGHSYNELADQLANQAIDEAKLKRGRL